MTDIAQNLSRIASDIGDAAASCGRNADDIALIAVSKMQPQEKILEALQAGQRLFGENKVQEAEKHWQGVKSDYPDLKLHLIGPLQTNKAAKAVALFDCIETVDRPGLVEALASETKKQKRNIDCFIQVNTGEEEQKAGVLPQGLPGLLATCVAHGLSIGGLMCIPPLDSPPGLHFAFLKTLAKRHNIKHLSMGMSADYPAAIRAGATYIRVGTAVFGERT